MPTINVQFEDAEKKRIIAVFGCAQDPTDYPNQASIDSGDIRYQTFLNNAGNDPWAIYKANAQAALDRSDITVLRCVENSVTVPTEWISYRKALRAIIGAATGDCAQPLPIPPTYPEGT